MAWTDEVDLKAVNKAAAAIAADPSLLRTALADPAAFLKHQCGVVSPVALTLTQTKDGLFLHPADQLSNSHVGYTIAIDDLLSEELTDDELDLVSAGSCIGPQPPPIKP